VSAPTTQAIHISTPKCEPGIGKIIRAPESADLIEGVRVRAYDLWPDDRGYFLEVVRIKQGLSADFVPEMTQVSAALSYPGTIKAFHFHQHQTDLWAPAQGMFQVALVDLRAWIAHLRVEEHCIPARSSPGRFDSARHRPRLQSDRRERRHADLRHQSPVRSQDEGRIPYNDPSIAYDWELQHK
jgi:dTDP-4-dehydrorhamnose 3,5-epimerase